MVKKNFPLKTGDIILMALILLASIAVFLLPFLKNESASAEILIAETGEKRIISLDKEAFYGITSNGVSLTVCVENGKVFVLNSDCRDKICSATPPISYSGQTIICAPAGIVIRILGEEAIVDGVAG